MKNLVIVESGAKATKINEYLDKNFPDQDWKVTACLGHIRDLPDDESAVNPENWMDLSSDNPNEYFGGGFGFCEFVDFPTNSVAALSQ